MWAAVRKANTIEGHGREWGEEESHRRKGGEEYKGLHPKEQAVDSCGCSVDWNDASNYLKFFKVLLFL